LTTKSTIFSKLLLRAIDETLNSLWESVKQSIYFHIENKASINRNEIPENLQQFQEGLETIFGTGARYIEILIMKNLHSEIRCPLVMKKSEQLEFIEYVNESKQSYLGNIPDQTFASKPWALSPFSVFTVSVAKP
jgi:alpha-L-arabinofuranosidase